MPTKKKKIISQRSTQTRLPYAVSKRKKDESFEVSRSKRAKAYSVISDSDESSSVENDDDDNKSSQIGAVDSSVTAWSDEEDNDSDTGSVIVVDSGPIAVEAKGATEAAAQVAPPDSNLDRLFRKVIPIEVHQNIAKFLPHDRDVVRYSQICRTTRDAMSDSVWRYRFLERFDAVPDGPVELLREKYQVRHRTTKLYTMFDYNKYKYLPSGDIARIEKAQEKVLDMLQNLIIESDAHKGYGDNGDEMIVSRNIDYIRQYVEGSFVSGTTHAGDIIDIIDSIGKTRNDWDLKAVCSVDSNVNTRVLLIQLCLTSISWDPRYCTNTISQFDLSQLEVYAPPARQPLFLGKWKGDLNVRWCLHVANFFKFHLKAGKGEGLLAHAYAELEQSQLPQPWLGRLKSGTQKLGSHWKGAYFYVNPDELARMRQAGEDTDDGPYSDELDGGESFQDISLFFDDKIFGKQHWPKSWETTLHSDPFSNAAPEPISQRRTSRRATRSKKDFKKPKENPNPGVEYFYGSSHDSSSTAHFYGAVHGIPPQHGISGFQRITIMKFFPDQNGFHDPGQSWGYEGCVLPGGRIIVGRWFDAQSRSSRDVMSGPFVFWNTDKSYATEPIDGKEALKFFDHLKRYNHC
ncbi:uncharacterized protein EAF01_010100 [Botrytis porri]|uniref:uncharacterized protein n=1 Tax=Botrytis porri TaxID=87229 RepID=UPI0019003179|nr:uncharacterized protein EAF01_010100 [Botrytis porri]KAF7894650.1 hypothetical protein EAF01_010100 [Botrytis porri]